MTTDDEKRRLRAVQDAIKDEISRNGEPQTGADLKRLFEKAKAAASGKRPDPELEKKLELARQLDKWRKP